MTVILKSLRVASANDKMAELFCRNSCAGAAVDMGFERRLAVNHVTGWLNDNMGQQRLHAAGQRVSPAREQPSVATRVEAALTRHRYKRLLRGVREMRLLRNDADMVDKEQVVNEQMGGEKPVSSIGSPLCQTFCNLIMVMRNADE